MKWHLMYEGPRLSHLLAKHIFLHPYVSKELGALLGFQDSHYLYYSDTKQNLHGGYYTKENMEKAKLFGFNFFTKNLFSWTKKQDQLHQHAKKIMDMHQLHKNISKIDKKTMVSLVKEMAPLRSELYVYVLSCQPQCTEGLGDQLKKLIQEKISDKKQREKVFLQLTLPEKKSFFTHEELDWLKIAIEAKQKKISFDIDEEKLKKEYPELFQKIHYHFEKYSLIPASDRTEAWDFDHFIRVLRHNLQSQENFKEKFDRLHDQYEKSVQTKNELIKKYGLPQDALSLGQAIAEIGYYRFLTSFYGRWLGYYYVLICRKLAEESDLSFQEISSCTEDELIHFIKTGEANKKELEKRALAETLLIENNTISVTFGEEAIKTREAQLKNTDYSQVRELKGEIGCLGKVQGKAFVFYWNDDINKKIHEVPENSILIAPQTHPTYLPAMRKALAFATDEGGITGHAAIVAREMNKPCVIGLHFITKVVKTGDLIEIDAHEGIVRILERKESL
ncbi:hypothetical protein J4410_05910 [Candidatus Woesearchaeota archaeon]|nr:hypothetical protein [Candidatus Woesearchaeota archaeon]